MHELSIAYSLVEAANTAAREAGASSVEAVHMRLGLLAGVVKESLLFSFDIASEGTLLAGAKLIIKEIPITIFCTECNEEADLASIQSFRCPRCNTPSGNIVHGRELEIVGLEIQEH